MISRKNLLLRNKRIGLALEKAWKEHRVKPISKIAIEKRNASIKKTYNTKEQRIKSKRITERLWEKGTFDHLSNKFKGKGNPFYGKRHSLETKKKLSKIAQSRIGKKNPMFGKSRPDTIERNIKNNPMWNLSEKQRKSMNAKLRKSTIAFHKKFPEKHPNRILAKNGRSSYQQKELYKKIKKIYHSAEHEQPIPDTSRWADIMLRNKKIDIEYDGEFWHKNKKSDNKRDKEVKKAGWKVIRFNKNNIQNYKKVLKNRLR